MAVSAFDPTGVDATRAPQTHHDTIDMEPPRRVPHPFRCALDANLKDSVQPSDGDICKPDVLESQDSAKIEEVTLMRPFHGNL